MATNFDVGEVETDGTGIESKNHVSHKTFDLPASSPPSDLFRESSLSPTLPYLNLIEESGEGMEGDTTLVIEGESGLTFHSSDPVTSTEVITSSRTVVPTINNQGH